MTTYILMQKRVRVATVLGHRPLRTRDESSVVPLDAAGNPGRARNIEQIGSSLVFVLRLCLAMIEC